MVPPAGSAWVWRRGHLCFGHSPTLGPGWPSQTPVTTVHSPRRSADPAAFFFLQLIFTGVQLLGNIVFPAVRQSESATHRCISPPFGVSFPLGDRRALNTAAWAEQQVLISCLFDTQSQQRLDISPNLPILPSPHPPVLPWYPCVCSLFLLCKEDHQYHFSRFHMYASI